MPHHIIYRIALEECASLDELMDVYSNYSGYIGGSYLWSDIKTSTGILIENISTEQSVYKITETYNIYDVVKILRTTAGPFSSLYYKEDLAWGICNLMTHNMIIFNSKGHGFYMANGKSYGSCNAIFYFSDDFTKSPVLFLPQIKINSCEKEIGNIEGGIYTDEEKFYLYKELDKSYPKISTIHFLAGSYAFKAGLLSEWIEYIAKAREILPDNPEYNIEYAGVLIYQKQYDEAFHLLNNIHIDYNYSIRYKALHLALLSNLCKVKNLRNRAQELKKEYEILLQEKQYIDQIETYIKTITYYLK